MDSSLFLSLSLSLSLSHQKEDGDDDDDDDDDDDGDEGGDDNTPISGSDGVAILPPAIEPEAMLEQLQDWGQTARGWYDQAQVLGDEVAALGDMTPRTRREHVHRLQSAVDSLMEQNAAAMRRVERFEERACSAFGAARGHVDDASEGDQVQCTDELFALVTFFSIVQILPLLTLHPDLLLLFYKPDGRRRRCQHRRLPGQRKIPRKPRWTSGSNKEPWYRHGRRHQRDRKNPQDPIRWRRCASLYFVPSFLDRRSSSP